MNIFCCWNVFLKVQAQIVFWKNRNFIRLSYCYDSMTYCINKPWLLFSTSPLSIKFSPQSTLKVFYENVAPAFYFERLFWLWLEILLSLPPPLPRLFFSISIEMILWGMTDFIWFYLYWTLFSFLSLFGVFLTAFALFPQFRICVVSSI